MSRLDTGDRVDVVMDVEWLEDGSVRVHCLGVFDPDDRETPRPLGANTVQAWLNVPRQPIGVGVFKIDTRTNKEKEQE